MRYVALCVAILSLCFAVAYGHWNFEHRLARLEKLCDTLDVDLTESVRRERNRSQRELDVSVTILWLKAVALESRGEAPKGFADQVFAVFASGKSLNEKAAEVRRMMEDVERRRVLVGPR